MVDGDVVAVAVFYLVAAKCTGLPVVAHLRAVGSGYGYLDVLYRIVRVVGAGVHARKPVIESDRLIPVPGAMHRFYSIFVVFPAGPRLVSIEPQLSMMNLMKCWLL